MLEAATSLSATAPQETRPSEPDHHISFHDVLSALNPIQYLPVLGTIYRAATGDQIPEPMRRIGSFIVSGLLGGPVGAAINVATLAAEKISGIDLDKTGQNVLSGHLAAAKPAADPTPTPAPAQAASPGPTSPADPLPAAAWSPAQLATYGVSTTGDGILKCADLTGADVLNALELSRIQVAHSAYGRALRLAA